MSNYVIIKIFAFIIAIIYHILKFKEMESLEKNKNTSKRPRVH